MVDKEGIMVRERLPGRRLICLTTRLTATQPTGLCCQMSLLSDVAKSKKVPQKKGTMNRNDQKN